MLDTTPFLRLYAKYRQGVLNELNPAVVQEQELLSLVKKAARTNFGLDHEFDRIAGVEDFQRRVPLRPYEQMWEEYWKDSFPRLENCSWPGTIPFFAVSSGTSSGTTKYIPYSAEMTKSNAKAGLDLIVHHLQNRPKSRLLAGRSFVLGGSTDLVEQAPGIMSGDLSGIAVVTMPWLARQRYFPPRRLALLKNWEEKINILAKESLAADIRMIAGVPTWLLICFDKLRELVPESAGKLAGIYPDLEMIVHGGVNFVPYHDRFKELLNGSKAELREVYPASEGFIAIADRSFGDGLRLMLDHGIFFEFVPVEELGSATPTRHWIKNIECGVNYAVVMTTCAGLWSYVIGDTVKFMDRNPPRLLVTGRTSYCLSAFGEHVIAEEIEDAVNTAATMSNAQVSEYSVGAVYPRRPGELGGHLYIIEFGGRAPAVEDLSKFAARLDKRLCERNEDYEAHRAKGFGLREPQIISVRQGAFTDWMKARGKLGGQHKVPRIITKEDLFNDLRSWAEANRRD